MSTGSNRNNREARRSWRTWLPVGFLAVLFAVFVAGAVIGVNRLLPVTEAPKAESEQPLIIEEYSPAPVGPVYASNGNLITNPTGAILPTVDGLYNMDISTYSDRQIAHFMVDHAAYLAEMEIIPKPFPMREGANRWLHEIVTTPASEGGPDLEHGARFAQILDKWESGSAKSAYNDWEWLMRVIGSRRGSNAL